MNKSKALIRLDEAISIVKKAGLKDIVDQKYKGAVLKNRLDELALIQRVLDNMTTKEWNAIGNRHLENQAVSQTSMF